MVPVFLQDVQELVQQQEDPQALHADGVLVQKRQQAQNRGLSLVVQKPNERTCLIPGSCSVLATAHLFPNGAVLHQLPEGLSGEFEVQTVVL